MPATVVVGAQLGDEGKGKIVDFLADRADVVVRFQGGANAGHTVQVGEQLYAFHLLPSGVLRKRAMNVIGNGVVIDPAQLLKEIDETHALGHSVQNLRISDRAHVVMPYHKVIDGLEEKLKGNLGAGTTLRGIGPSFEDKVGRFGIRMCDLVDPVALREKLETIVPIKQRLIDAYGGTERPDLEGIYKEQVEYGARLPPFLADTPPGPDAAAAAGRLARSRDAPDGRAGERTREPRGHETRCARGPRSHPSVCELSVRRGSRQRIPREHARVVAMRTGLPRVQRLAGPHRIRLDRDREEREASAAGIGAEVSRIHRGAAQGSRPNHFGRSTSGRDDRSLKPFNSSTRARGPFPAERFALGAHTPCRFRSPSALRSARMR